MARQITRFSSPPAVEPLEPRLLLTAALYAVTDLGTLGGPASFAFALNDAAIVAGQSLGTNSPGSGRAFVWSRESGFMNLGVLPGFAVSEARGINNGGMVAGTSLNAQFDERAFLWQPGGELADLGTLGGGWSRATDINNLGQVVGASGLPAEQGVVGRAFLWQDGAMLELGTLGGATSLASAINDAGVIVGQAQTAAGPAFHAFVWQDGVMTGLGTLGGPASAAHAINNTGMIVGDADLSRRDADGFHLFHATLWHGGQTIDLGTLGGQFSSALGVNSDGVVVGWSETKLKDAQGDFLEHAFVSLDGVMLDLNSLIDDARWELTRATAINADGFITGFGQYRGSATGPVETRAFLLRPLYPDLTAAITQVSLANTVVPGDKGSVKVSVANAGETAAGGRVTIDVYASTDPALDGADVLIGTVTNRKVNLAPGRAGSHQVKLTIPPNLTPGTYYLVARVTPTQGVKELDASNNTGATETTRQVVWQFGNLPGRRSAKLTVTDQSGEAFTFSLKGPGFGTVTSGPNGLNVTLEDTTLRTAALVKAASKDDSVGIHDVTIHGALKSWDARGIDLRGNFNADAAVVKLTFDDAVTPGQQVILGLADNAKTRVTATFDRVADLSFFSQTPLALLQATDWLNADGLADVINVPALDRLAITGNRKAGLAGDFAANLVVTGAGQAVTQIILGNVAIAGTVLGGSWAVTGHVGQVQAMATTAAWQAAFAGRVRKLATREDLSGQLSAESIDDVTVGRDLLDAVVTLGPLTARREALGKLNVGRWMRRVDLRATGNVGSVTTGGTDTVNLFAGVRADRAELPAQVPDFDALASIQRLRINGIKGEPASVLDTDVSAWSIGQVTVQRAGVLPADSEGVNALGLAAHQFRSVTYRSDAGNLRLRRPDEFTSRPEHHLVLRVI